MRPLLSIQRNRALTLIEVLVIIFTIAVVVVVLLPALAASKRKSSRVGCISNIQQIGIAFRLWEGDNNDKYPMAVSVRNGGAMELITTGNVVACFRVMSNELSTPRILYCPADTNRTCATNFSNGFSDVNISYFINPEAAEAYPQMIMLGDDNLLVNGKPVQPGILNLWTNATVAWGKDRHHGVGNIGMADGSAQQVTSAGLQQANQVGLGTNTATGRWLIP